MNLSLAFTIAAVVIFVIAALIAFGVVAAGASVVGWLALGLACFAAGHLPV